MGTTVYRASKAQAVHDELRNIASHATLIAHRVIGNRLWFLAQHPASRDADITGLKWIGLTLMDCRNGEAAIKSMDETCGPCYYDCPLSFLDRADPPVGEYAGPWRQKVRAFHAQRSADAPCSEKAPVWTMATPATCCAHASVAAAGMFSANRTARSSA